MCSVCLYNSYMKSFATNFFLKLLSTNEQLSQIIINLQRLPRRFATQFLLPRIYYIILHTYRKNRWMYYTPHFSMLSPSTSKDLHQQETTASTPLMYKFACCICSHYFTSSRNLSSLPNLSTDGSFFFFGGAIARGGPWPPLQYASRPLNPLLCLSIRLSPSFSGPWTRHPAISFLVFLFVLLSYSFRYWVLKSLNKVRNRI